MSNAKPAIMSLVVLLTSFVITACGGGGGSAQDPDWQRMSIDGATVSFEMPKPIKMQEDAKSGQVLYVAKKEPKLSFRVGIQKRNFKADQAKGLTDEQVLQRYAAQVLKGSQQTFAKMKLNAQYRCDGSFKVANGIGTQYEAKVGKAIVLDRFYVNKMGLYWVEAITHDVNNKDIHRFLDSFSP